MDDLVEKVRNERGMMKKIELSLPGFRGYRKREDIRQSDQLLRHHLALRLEAVMRQLEAARTKASEEGDMAQLKAIGAALPKLRSFIADTRHAEAGYQGIGAAVNVLEPELLRLYDLDTKLLDEVQALEGATAQGLATKGGAVADLLTNTRSHFDARVSLLRGVA